jgi:putative ABC transport system permease protein
MLKNYIKIAWRNIVKNKSMFSINIAGLAIGIASCLIIILFVIDELSYDRFNEKADQIVRVVFRAKINSEEMKEAVVMAPVGATLKSEFPEVLQATRIRKIGTPKISYENNTYRNSRFAFVDPNFFDVFTLPIIKGDPVSPLQEPNTLVITNDEANKYFGDTNPVGKVMYLEGQDQPFKVTAVIDKVPENSHFHFDVFAFMEGYDAAKSTSWVNSNFFTYLVLEKGYDYKELESKLPKTIEKYMGPQIKNEIGMSFNEFIKENRMGLFLQPLIDIHLNSDFASATEIEQGGDIKYIYIFSAVALFMLLIACINFMNLSTAAAAKRSKEVGIRKVLGSKKNQLIYQFLTESFIVTTAAMIIATILFIVLLPLFNNLSGKELQIDYLLNPFVFGLLLVLTIVISLLAGGYPAFFLSSFKPIASLKSKLSSKGNNKGLRSGLVIFQFVISAGLILATLVVNQQMSFIQHKELGYDKDQMLVLRESYLLGNDEMAFKNEILKDSRVANVSSSAFVPAGPTDNNMSGIFIGEKFIRRMFVYNIDEQYIPTMGMELISGRNFSKEFGTDSTNVIINEQIAKILGFGKNALDKTFIRDTNNGKQNLTVIGVVKDFHFKSLHQTIEPLIMLNHSYGGLIVRAKVSDMSGLIKSINGLWNSFKAKEPFSYSILDDSYNQTYLIEQKMGTVLSVFALLTIFVACLGLFGLVTFTAEQRFKEIGIRKVLGSTVPQIVTMLSKDFLKLIFISFLIAFPLGFYFMNKWLQDFAYRIQIQWWIFALAGLITLLIAFLTISWKSFRAATINPVKALRSE